MFSDSPLSFSSLSFVINTAFCLLPLLQKFGRLNLICFTSIYLIAFQEKSLEPLLRYFRAEGKTKHALYSFMQNGDYQVQS